MNRKRASFGLGALFLVTVVVAVTLGWWRDRTLREQPLYLHVIQPTYYGVDASPPQRIATVRIARNRAFDIELDAGKYVRGQLKIDFKGNQEMELSVNLRTAFTYSGPIDSETLYSPSMFLISGPVIYMQQFVVSESADVERFLKKQAAHDQQAQADLAGAP